MPTIQLTRGKSTIVSKCDYCKLRRLKWRALKGKGGLWYACRTFKVDGKTVCVYMHREILNAGGREIVDHKDHDGLNNRRSNIRLTTQALNLRNTRRHFDGSSKFKGVTWDKRASKWVAQIYHKKKHVHIGTFSNEANAGKAYYARAQLLYGDFAFQETVK